MVRLEHIQEFVRLAECLSFTRASEELFVTQPSLSRHISMMEAELGVKLVARSTRHVRLTNAGKELYPIFAEMLNLYRQAVSKASIHAQGFTGALRIGSSHYMAENYIEERILEFNRLYPDVQVELCYDDPDQCVRQLMDGSVDLITCLLCEAEDKGLIHQRFATERLNVLMSADHPLAKRESLSVKELAGSRFIYVNSGEEPNGFERCMMDLLQEHGVTQGESLHVPVYDQLPMAIRQSGGVCLLMARIGNFGRSYLRSIPLQEEDFDVILCYGYCRDNPNETIARFVGG